MPAGRRVALALVEVLLVLAVLGVLAGGAWVALGRATAHRDAAALARALASARWLAVTTGEPRALVARGSDLHVVAGAPLRCDAVATGAPAWSPSRTIDLRWPVAGLAFGSHGRPLRCDGSAVGNATIELVAGDGSRAAVVVAALGRVRWERR